jgi:hypothetical protein
MAESLVPRGQRPQADRTDSYCHFLTKACGAQRPGGRVAVIVSASWLDMRYGAELKRCLLDDFRIEGLLAFDGRVFQNALIKPVVLIAEKGTIPKNAWFARLSADIPLSRLDSLLSYRDTSGGGLGSLNWRAQAQLSPDLPWSGLFHDPEVYSELVSSSFYAPLDRVAESRIGLQTFAKKFYVHTRREWQRIGVEPEALAPFALSPKSFRSPLISDAAQVPHLVLACDESHAQLTGVGRYIAEGMNSQVAIRGKGVTVHGFHEVPRILRSGRRPWYNLRTDILRRGRYPILLPRRTFRSYLVVHNKASVVANEDFIELRPNAEHEVEALLSFLNSSFGEFIVRSNAFQYGGGVFDLRPGRLHQMPILNMEELPTSARERLTDAWHRFVEGNGSAGRGVLDHEVAVALDISPNLHVQVTASLRRLVGLAESAGTPHYSN